MKNIIFAILLLITAPFAFAQYDKWAYHGGHYVWHPQYGWSIPVIVSGVIVGYEITRPEGAVVPKPKYTPPQLPAYQPPYGYHWEAILNAECNCYSVVAVPSR